jgi:hypothetical protein
MRTIRRTEAKRNGRRRQRDVLCDVMLGARECETWLTLDELAALAACFRRANISQVPNEDAARKTSATNTGRHTDETGLEFIGVAGWTA